ncbi:MAG TPA: PRC-barrel domain-containing protein, partial [Tepidisphaeraceae bacterium]
MNATSEIAIGAKVMCADGELGNLTDVIVHPVRRRITHVVVEERHGLGRALMVPVEHIAETARDAVRLSCTLAEAAKLPEFYATRYVPMSSPEAQPAIEAWQTDMALRAGSDGYYSPYVTWPGGDVPVTEERVPPGEVAFHRGTGVSANDGQEVGTVEEFVVDPGDDAITHFVVRLGHLRGAREVALPVSTVASASPGMVRLTLSQEEIERLPAISARRHYQWSSGSAGEVELVTLVFSAPKTAGQALASVKEHVSAGRLPKVDTATLTKTSGGKVSSRQEHDMSGGRGAVLGAIAGGAVSLLA